MKLTKLEQRSVLNAIKLVESSDVTYSCEALDISYSKLTLKYKCFWYGHDIRKKYADFYGQNWDEYWEYEDSYLCRLRYDPNQKNIRVFMLLLFLEANK